MMRRGAIALGVAVVIALTRTEAALAQAAPTTLLHLSATSSVQASPDQLVAALVAQSTSSSAADAQRRVNALMTEGMRATQGTTGIEARAVGYSVYPADDKRTTWTAQQTLELRGSDGPVLLDLAGRLQEKGFAAATLDWQLSSGLRRRTHDEATTAALKELQTRATAAAATLGLHIDHLQDVRLDGAASQPRPLLPAQTMALRAALPPQTTAAPEEVTAEVSADVVLRP